MISTSSFSCAGRKGANQDSFLIEQLNNERFLLAIADGMGGEDGGQIASHLAINSLKNDFISNPFINLNTAFENVQKTFIEKVALEPQLKKMGTTLTACLINKNTVSLAHVGDTRIYHLRGNGIISRTKDQSELQQLLDEKIITKARAKNYPRKNILLSVMSAYREFKLQALSFEVMNGDRLLFLTDGAYSLISKRDIRDYSITNKQISGLVGKIRSHIESKEIKDDYTVVGCELNIS